jgi:hypothetical protein
MLLAMSVTLGGCPPRAEPYLFFYASDNGVMVPLILDTDSIALMFDEDISEGERAAILDGEPLIPGPIGDAAGGFTGGLLVPGVTEGEVLEMMDRLNATPGVDWANPIVLRDFRAAGIRVTWYETIEHAIAPEFLAEFPASTDVADIDGLNETENVEARLVDTTEDSIVYYIRVTSESGRTTLEMANFYHEHPLTTRAYPFFWPVAFT